MSLCGALIVLDGAAVSAVAGEMTSVAVLAAGALATVAAGVLAGDAAVALDEAGGKNKFITIFSCLGELAKCGLATCLFWRNVVKL